jgi:hypothetical protein
MKIFIFDIDNTISKTKENKYQIAKPIKSKIKIINRLFDKGHIIKIFTSRYMGKYNGDVNFIKKKYYKRTEIQLKSWGLKFHDLIFGKPIFDFLIDDKAFNIKDKRLNKIFYDLLN